MTGEPVAVLWDFDGTLAETEGLWRVSEREIMASLGLEATTEHHAQIAGLPCQVACQRMADMADRPDADVAELARWQVDFMVRALDEQPIVWQPGAATLLAELRAADVPCALVSASPRVILDTTVHQLPTGSFDAIVAGDDVVHGKPHPEPYLTAAAHLGVDPRECLVIEDSPTGAASGNAAGAVVLGISSFTPLPDSPRRALRPTLDGLTWADLQALYASVA